MIKKKKLIKKISFELGKIDGIISVTFVGSFLKKKFFSDIDLVLVSEKINKKIIYNCRKTLKRIKLSNYGIHKKILINDTFGPLKFNTHKNIVFHLMIYSRKDHINHVLESPFTCFDWERTPANYGQNLIDIYPVSKIFITDFFNKNRGINTYKKNLITQKINYKKYFIKNNKILIKKLNYQISGKDVLELCFHIIFFTIQNYLKFINDKNKIFDRSESLNFLKNIIGKKKLKNFILFYLKLENFKKNGKTRLQNKDAIKLTLSFLKNFETFIKKELKNSISIDFKRHFKTKYRKDIFIGQKINPPIQKKTNLISKKIYNLSYSSPSLRCTQTSKFYSKKTKINSLLKEINYGLAEGLNLRKLNQSYPYILKKWQQNKDVKFPKGESLKDVNSRVKNFKKIILNLTNEKKYLVVTHNVFLRSLIGSYFKIPLNKWYLIKVGYGDNINFKKIKNKLFINISRKKINRFLKKVYENSNSN